MDPLKIDIRPIAPTDLAVLPLISAHLSLMRASSPACSVHAMEASQLGESNAQFFAAFDGGEAIAIGAVRTISEYHGELKSMHVRSDRRGKGVADAMLAELLERAQRLGLTRISLETGSQKAFLPARTFYIRHGFSECAPFGDYGIDPNSVFMTRAI